MQTLPLIDPRRPATGMRPLKAWRHFRNLVADKEDTEQVFHILEALRDNRFLSATQAFAATPVGARVMEEGEYLPDLLDDHVRLRRMPSGSLAHAYCDFMETEGLTAAGLVAEQEKFRVGQAQFDDQLERYGNRLRDMHDLFHVLTGYGRDALGEQCVLAFSYSQTPSWGILFIAYAGAREIRKALGARYPVYAAVREGQRHGRIAAKIANQDIMSMLAEPLDVLRARLNIQTPQIYQRVHAMLRADGIDPYDLMGQTVTADDAPVLAAAA